MPRRRPTNRIGKCTPQWLALLIEMRLVTPKQAHEAHLRATKQAEQESGASPDKPPPQEARLTLPRIPEHPLVRGPAKA